MTSSAGIRALSADDAAAIRGVNALFADAFDDPDHYAKAPPTDAYLTRLLGNPANIVVVAEAGDAIVGALVAYQLDKFEQARSELYIYDLAVAEAYRRRGIATRLIAHLQGLAAERGAWVIYVQADYGDDPAIALYTKLGVREDVMHFDVPVRIQA